MSNQYLREILAKNNKKNNNVYNKHALGTNNNKSNETEKK